ncbi:MAG: Trk system potassium transporter TrkA [Ruminococcus sp.]|nr:Trk system potassium transporter TrkA [Ruminococcus sp.]
MNIIIVGCGKVGEALAEQLNENGNDITVVDIDSDRVEYIVNKHDVLGVVGNGATHATLEEARSEDADLLIAVTGSDELNLLCCLIAQKAGNCQVIARVRNPEYSSEASYLKRELELAMVINPEQAAAAEMTRILRFPSAIKIETFARGKIELLKFILPEDSPLVGCTVKEITTKLHCDVLVCTVERDDEVYIANGDLLFRKRDVISIIASPQNANRFFHKINYVADSVKDVMIVGGGEISYYLCQMLTRVGIRTTIIEKNQARCDELSIQLPETLVIHGDAADQEILLEEGLETVDAFAALTNLDEENILLSLFAKSRSKAKLITKINRIDFDEVIKSLTLDTIIYPKSVTCESIIRYVRAMKNSLNSNIETLYHIIKGKVEAAEFFIRHDNALTGTPLYQLRFRPNVLIAGILRDNAVITPKGQDVIQPGDSVIVVSKDLVLNDITDILRD